MELWKFTLVRGRPPVELRIHGGWWVLFGGSYECVSGFKMATLNIGPFALQLTWGELRYDS